MRLPARSAGLHGDGNLAQLDRQSPPTGIKIVFINGRISDRSIGSYTKIRWLIKPVLEKVDAFSMISEADARRIIIVWVHRRIGSKLMAMRKWTPGSNPG
jgi:hypothetical protein